MYGAVADVNFAQGLAAQFEAATLSMVQYEQIGTSCSVLSEVYGWGLFKVAKYYLVESQDESAHDMGFVIDVSDLQI